MTNPLDTLDTGLARLRAEWAGAAPAFGDAALDEVTAMSDLGLVRVLDAAGALRRRLDAALAALSAEADRRSDPGFGAESLAKQHGQRNTTHLVANVLGTTPRQAAVLVRVGVATRPRASILGGVLPARRPAVAAALTGGQIGLDAADMICNMLDRVAPRTSTARADAYETELASFAINTPYSLLQRAVTHAEARLDPDGVEPRDRALHEQRSFTMTEEPSGMVRLHGRLDAGTAAPIKAAVEQLVSDVLQRRRTGTDHTAPTDGDGTGAGTGTGGHGDGDECPGPVLDDLRTIPQLQADALADLARHALGCTEMPTAAKTTVIIRLEADALADALGQATAPDQRAPGSPASAPAPAPATAAAAPAPAAPAPSSTLAPAPADSTAGRVLRPEVLDAALGTIDGFDRVMSATTLRRLAADAEIIPVVLGSRGEPLDVGRAKRFFTRAQRIALAERDGGCAACGRNIAYVDAHHILWWKRDTGPTDIDNGVLLCTHCHHQLHQTGWRIIARRHEIWFIPPPHIDPEQRPRLGGRARFQLRPAA